MSDSNKIGPAQADSILYDSPEMQALIHKLTSSKQGRTTPLHRAAREGNIALARASLAAGISVNAREPSGMTPLHLAKSREIAEMLLQHGAGIDIRSEMGGVPLETHARNGHADIITLLLAADADANALNISARSPIDYANDECRQLLAAAGGVPGPLARYTKRIQAAAPSVSLSSRPVASSAYFVPTTFRSDGDPWKTVREFVDSWVPDVDWRSSVTSDELDAVEEKFGFQFPTIIRSFYLSGMFDFLFRLGLGLDERQDSEFRVGTIWLPPEAMLQQSEPDALFICNLDLLRRFAFLPHEFDEADPPVREYRYKLGLDLWMDACGFASRTFSEFVLQQAAQLVAELTPAQRTYYEMPPLGLRRLAKETLKRLPYTVCRWHIMETAWEGPDVIYFELRFLAGEVQCTGNVIARDETALQRFLEACDES